MNMFDTVQYSAPKRNKFDLSHEVKCSLNMGPIVPIMCEEIIPGDQWRVSSSVFIRFLALFAPVMHRVDVTLHSWWVPNRLIWANWEDFITGGRLGVSAPVFPTMSNVNVNAQSVANFRPGSLIDYLGGAVHNTSQTMNVGYNGVIQSVLPLRAYQLIYDTFYRDQNLTASVLTANFKADGDVSGADLAALLPLRVRAWQKDLYTSALPFVQRGSAVSVPAAVTYLKPAKLRRASDDLTQNSTTAMGTDATGNLQTTNGTNIGTSYLDDISGISFTINALRTSARLQEWLEKNATGGARYKEFLGAHFGVVLDDYRAGRPVYLGGSRAPVVISEVLQQSASVVGQTPLATMAGHGYSSHGNGGFKYFFQEHGFVMTLMSIIPVTAYQQRQDKMWIRFTNTDYFFPSFAHLGEQPVFSGDVYSNWADAAGVSLRGNVFGYQSRYAEYKYRPDRVSGSFRDTLAFWHLGRIFAATPTLNTSFIECDARSDIFATVSDVHHVLAQVFHKVDALRPMPYFATPTF